MPDNNVVIDEIVIPDWQSLIETVELRIYSSKAWVSADGTPHMAGSPTDALSADKFYAQKLCQINTDAKTCTIPAITLTSTKDASAGSDTTLVAAFFNVGLDSPRFMSYYSVFNGFKIPPSPTSTTWAALVAVPETLTGWKYRQPITLTNISGRTIRHAQHPITLDASNFDFSRAAEFGEDIRFTDEDGTVLSHYTLSFDSITETASYHVKIPLFPVGQATTIYVYYGKEGASPSSSYENTYTKGVVDAATDGLWHLDEGSGTTAANSVTGGTALTLVGSPAWGADTAFQAGASVILNGTNQCLEAAGVWDEFPPVWSVRYTATPMVNRGIGAGGERLFFKIATALPAPVNQLDHYVDPVSGAIKFLAYHNWTSGAIATVSSLITSWIAGMPYRFVITGDNTFMHVWINNVWQGKAPLAGMGHAAGAGAQPLTFGALNADGTRANFAPWKFDEIAILSRFTHPDEVAADHERRILIPTRQVNKWIRPAAASLVPETVYEGHHSGEYGAVVEPTVFDNGNGTFDAYYTSTNETDGKYTISVMQAPTPRGAWTRDAANPLIGWGAGGAGATEHANSSGGFQIGSVRYLMCGNGYTQGGQISVFKSLAAPWRDFTKVGVAVPSNALPGMTQTGNCTVWPELVDGLYHGLFDGQNSNTGLWEMGHMTSPDGESWTIDEDAGWLTSMRVHPSGMFGGAYLMRIGEVWHAFYHYGDYGGANHSGMPNGQTPTPIAHASGTDITAMVPSSQQPVVALDGSYTSRVDDQDGDPWIIQSGGKCYMYVDCINNAPQLVGNIAILTFNGTLLELLAEETPMAFGAVETL